MISIMDLAGCRRSATRPDDAGAPGAEPTTAEIRAEVERRPPARAASPRVTLPAGAPWQTAEVRVTWEAVWPQPEIRFEASPHVSVDHLLVLGDARGDHAFLLDRHFLGAAGDGIHVAWPDFVALLDARYEIQAAPDGHALAVSNDGGRSYRYAGLDAGSMPLYCLHHAWAPGDAGVWAGAPSTRALALEIFAATDPRSPSIHRGADSPAVSRFERELRAAGAYACLHQADGEIAPAFATAFVNPGSHLTSDDERPLLDCLRSMARSSAAVRDTFLRALDGRGHDLARIRAADVLSGSADAGVQEALSRALLARDFDPGDGCHVLTALAAGLSRITLARGAAGEGARAALAAVLDGSRGCHDRVQRDAQANAIRGLAAIAPRDPIARAAIEAAARLHCEPPPGSTGPLPVWTIELTGAGDAAGRSWSPACWAAAALGAIGRPGHR